MEGCINNKIQVYLEQLISKFGVIGCQGDDQKEELYDWYKDVRTEIASKGFLYLKEKHNKENFISNPKSIAGGLYYLFCVKNAIDITQKKIQDEIGTNQLAIRKSYRAVKNLLDQ